MVAMVIISSPPKAAVLSLSERLPVPVPYLLGEHSCAEQVQSPAVPQQHLQE